MLKTFSSTEQDNTYFFPIFLFWSNKKYIEIFFKNIFTSTNVLRKHSRFQTITYNSLVETDHIIVKMTHFKRRFNVTSPYLEDEYVL